MRKFILFFSMFVAFGVSAQEVSSKKFEYDVAVSPRVESVLNQADVVSGNVAVRYVFSPHFSAGVGLAPTFIEYYVGETNYVPLFLSFRYTITTGKSLSPYFLLNLGGSFLQLEPDGELQGRFAIGAGYHVSAGCSVFAEVGMSYITERTLWTPLSVGIRF